MVCAALLLHGVREPETACSYKQTIGVDFFLKQLTLPGGKRVAVQVCISTTCSSTCLCAFV